MDQVIDFFKKIDNFITPYFEKAISFISNGWNIIYVIIAAFIILMALIGLLYCLIRFRKLTMLLIIVLAAACVASYILIYKG